MLGSWVPEINLKYFIAADMPHKTFNVVSSMQRRDKFQDGPPGQEMSPQVDADVKKQIKPAFLWLCILFHILGRPLRHIWRTRQSDGLFSTTNFLNVHIFDVATGNLHAKETLEQI